jgi:alpha,alpha-trehalase
MRADRDLEAVAKRLGRDRDARELAQWIERSLAAFARLRHQDGSYRSLDLRSGQLAPVATSAGFLPLYARAVGKPEAGRLRHLLGEWGKRAHYLVPSVDPAAQGFDPHRYWRGPAWFIVNRMLADGFAGYGAEAEARRIRGDSRALAETAGLREYYDPLTGAGLGGGDFSWTAAMWLAWIGDDRQPDLLTAV